ncbi:MAG: stalk domain-containing protein [Defluviitaleaceae bacterium]|nr:stalk domain-containing protein [Defluviitaleaceae bacterium]
MKVIKAIKAKKIKILLISLITVVATAVSTTVVYGYSPANPVAPIAIVLDYHTGEVLYERDAYRRWVPASMTKSVAAFVVYEEIERGNLTLDTMIPVSQHAATVSTNAGTPRLQGSEVRFNAGQYVSVDMLLTLMMLPSANAGSVILGEYMFGSDQALIDRMNEVMEERGLYSSFFNSHGAQPHHTNAYSIARLTHEFIQRFPDILRITNQRSVSFNGAHWVNTNRLVNWDLMPEADGFKTGSLRQAGWNHSTTAYRNGRRVVAVLMSAPNVESSMSESIRLLNFGFEELQRRETARLNRINNVFFGSTLRTLEERPIIREGNLLLPLSLLGMDVNLYHGNMEITGENTAVNVHVGRTTAFVNGRVESFDAPVVVYNHTIYAPLSFFEVVLDADTYWDIETGVVTINKR